MTGPLFAIDIRGREGRSLREAWKDGPRTYLGLAIDGLPNAFLITGPGSPAVLANMVLAIEQHVDWIADCIESMRERGDTQVEVSAEAVDGWMGQVRDLAESTLFPLANSWYVGANVPGKPRVFALYVGGFGAFREICDEVAEDGYRGFVFASSDEAVGSRR
jgi:cyclohexanone monooxygenase